jgi:hypothetical protein
MGHGVWMGITCGNMENGRMGLKHSSWNIICFGGICFKGSYCSGIEMHVESPVETWHVLMGGRFQGFKVQVSRLMFCGAQFSTGQNEYRAATKTRHVSVLVCSRACAGCAWKPAPSCLKVSYAFTTCR